MLKTSSENQSWSHLPKTNQSGPHLKTRQWGSRKWEGRQWIKLSNKIRPVSLGLGLMSSCIFFFIHLFNFWLHWVFAAARGLSLVAVSGGYSLLRGAGLPLQWPLPLQSTGSRCTGFSGCGTRASVVVAHGLWSAGSVVVAHGPSRSAACGIFPDQGSNPCPLHWQADS